MPQLTVDDVHFFKAGSQCFRGTLNLWNHTAGDGFLASFEGPAKGVRCAKAIRDSLRPLGIEIRAGIHTGECERSGEKLAGIAVHIGARVAGLAEAGQVLVSRTVKDLVAGSGLTFADHGTHRLKGVSDQWQLFLAE